MSGGDIRVNTDKLKGHAERYDAHLKWMDSHIGKLEAGPLQEAADARRDASGGRYGGFYAAVNLATYNGRLAEEMIWLQEKIRGGLVTAKNGINTTVHNYRSVDEQRSLEFAEIEKLLPGKTAGSGGDEG